MKRLLFLLALALILLAAVVLVRTLRFTSRQVPAEAATAFEPLPGAAERLSDALRLPTVAYDDYARRDTSAFAAFHAFLARAYPRVHAALARKDVPPDALLYTWAGTDPGADPVVLMGHMDVVPVEPGTEARWTHPPFAGQIADGYVWGRGAIDDKAGVLGVLEAAEALLAQGFRPRRTVYFSFGADEESGGRGAAAVAETLRQRGIRPALVLDEGGAVLDGIVPGVARPVAVVGIAEKGYLSVELSAEAEGGHSSMPPRHTAAGRVARAVARLEDHPFPAHRGGAGARFFAYVGPEMAFGMRLLFANEWLFGPLITRVLAASPDTDATLRTTTAVTMLEGSPKDNVLPVRARAVVNFRLLPGDRVDDVLDRVRRVVDDPDVTVHPYTENPSEPGPVASTGSEAWTLLQRTIRQVYPEAVVAPYLVLGATDARYFRELSPSVYNFNPMIARPGDLERGHGVDERVAVADYRRGLHFFAQLLLNAAGAGGTP